MAARLSAFLVWAALAASAVFWGLRLGSGALSAPRHTVPVADVVVPTADLSRLFGAEPTPVADTPAATPAASRFQLVGVVAPRGGAAQGVALVAVDGNPPRPYRIGAAIDADLVLQGVETRAALIGPPGGPASVRLELPPPPTAATGTLPPPAPGLAPARPVARPAATPPAQPPAPVGAPPLEEGAQPAPVMVQPQGENPPSPDEPQQPLPGTVQMSR